MTAASAGFASIARSRTRISTRTHLAILAHQSDTLTRVDLVLRVVASISFDHHFGWFLKALLPSLKIRVLS